ncbi:unnamed protein product [Hermetia illucens]|uniref:Chaoptin n=2 Tax=Hermetia illucens TaxID=343691 RepID=A0A7R8UR23_HERIL|nr:unnamed protein product [Hermetia illucens]
MNTANNNFTILNINHEILYSCSVNSMCQCSSLPNESSTLFEVACNEVLLYKAPDFIHSSIKHIEISGTKIQFIDDETFQSLRLESLKLVDNKIYDLSERSFSSMVHSLQTLDLSGNQLQKIPLIALRKLHMLSRFIGHRNDISNLDGNWGNLCDSLRSVHLSANNIAELISLEEEARANYSGSFLPSHQICSFSRLKRLMWLDLSNNRISQLPRTSLPRTIVTLDVSRNIISTFPQQLFDHLHDLRIISLRDNLIRSISCKEIHAKRIHLEKLDLSLNLIDELQSDVFHNNYSNIQVRAINLEKNFIKFIPAAAFHQSKIVHLVMAFNEITKIHVDAFEGIRESLEYLDLDGNNLQAVPRAIKSLMKLKYLYLSSNHINHLSNLPDMNGSLRVLSLSGNNFSSIPIEGLRNFTELTYLNMGYNKISEILDDTFVGWGSQLQTILLRNNKITQLSNGIFNGLDSIKEISLSFNDIHYVSNNAFENVSRTLKILELSFGIYRDDFPKDALNPLTELVWLGLDNNNLKIVNEHSLATMRELSYINLSFNRITNLPRNLFSAEIHNHLMEVVLSFNLISRIHSNTFHGLLELQHINLASNSIRTLEKNSFTKLPYLTFIDLSNNNLKNISDAAFQYLPNLAKVDMSENFLCTLSLRMFNHVSNSTFPLLLNVSHNRISLFDDDLTSYLYIHHLDASFNLLTNSLSFSNLGNTLRILDLKSNSFSVLGNHAFGDLEFLETLNLSNNNITSLRRRSFQGLTHLQELDISFNKLQQLQVEQFSNLKKLRVLNLRNNKIRAFPREVFLNTRLEFLDISNNFLAVWPVSAFSDVGFTLRNIQFSSNNIEYLDSSMFINSQFLTDLNLSKNKITVLPDNTFVFLNNLTNLDLSYNPLVSTNLRQVFLHTLRLRKLSLQGLGLFNLPRLDLQFLSELDVSNNDLQHIHSLHDLTMLKTLNLSNNKISNASIICEHLPITLKILDFSHNPIRKITLHDVTPLRSLTDLDLTDIKIQTPAIFLKLRNLKVLRITSSSNLGEIVSKLPGLQKLYVHVIESAIQDDLFAKFSNNTKLNLVEIFGKNVQSISGNALAGLKNNHKLKIRIRNTKISDLPPGIFFVLSKVPQLTIDISDNKITNLSPDSFYPNASSWDAVGTRSIIGGLDIVNNPLECDCGLVWLGHWLRRWLRESAQINAIPREDMQKMVTRARRNTCNDPGTGRKLSFLELFPQDLLCHASALSSSAYTRLKRASTVLTFILPVFVAFLQFA